MDLQIRLMHYFLLGVALLFLLVLVGAAYGHLDGSSWYHGDLIRGD